MFSFPNHKHKSQGDITCKEACRVKERKVLQSYSKVLSRVGSAKLLFRFDRLTGRPLGYPLNASDFPMVAFYNRKGYANMLP